MIRRCQSNYMLRYDILQTEVTIAHSHKVLNIMNWYFLHMLKYTLKPPAVVNFKLEVQTLVRENIYIHNWHVRLLLNNVTSTKTAYTISYTWQIGEMLDSWKPALNEYANVTREDTHLKFNLNPRLHSYFMRAAKVLLSLQICAGLPKHWLFNNVITIRISIL